MSNDAIEIPKGITPREFFERFVPETFNRRVKAYDMSGYAGFTLNVQFCIDGPEPEGGKYGLRIIDGCRVETCIGPIDTPVITYSFAHNWFGEAVEGNLPWLPLKLAFDPQELRDTLSPEQAQEQMGILKGISGQAEVSLTTEKGAIASLRANFHQADDPAVVFRLTEPVVERIRAREITVMEAFMASLFKVEGPVEFAMHVMALAPDREEEEDDEDW